jgi:hypothetical protein
VAGLVTFCVETAFSNGLIEGKIKRRIEVTEKARKKTKEATG